MKRNRARKTFFDWDVNMVAKNQIDNTGFDVMDYLNKGKKIVTLAKKKFNGKEFVVDDFLKKIKLIGINYDDVVKQLAKLKYKKSVFEGDLKGMEVNFIPFFSEFKIRKNEEVDAIAYKSSRKGVDITIYIPENSFFAQFHKNHSTNFQKEVRKILNNSISYIENSDENLFITREILENAFQRINSFSPVSMDMLKSKTAPAHDNPTKAGDLSSLTDSFKSGDNSLVVENTDKSFSNNAASKQFIAVEEEDIKFDSSKESSSSQKKDESNNQEYTAEQVEEFLKGLGSLSP